MATDAAVSRLMGMGAEQARKHWGWTLFLGILFIILGVAAILMPLAAGLGLRAFLGWLLIFVGAIELVRAFKSQGWKCFLIDVLTGLFYLAGGLLLIFRPFASLIAIGTLIAGFFLVEGVMRIVLALQMDKAAGWGWVLFHGILSIGLGLLLFLQWPFSALWLPGFLVGIWMLQFGITTTMVASAARKALDEVPEEPGPVADAA